MAYSRWDKNYFYTYGSGNNGVNKIICETFCVAPDPSLLPGNLNGEYVEFKIQYGSLKKKNLREKFLNDCTQYLDEVGKEVLKKDLNILIDKFMKDVEIDYDGL